MRTSGFAGTVVAGAVAILLALPGPAKAQTPQYTAEFLGAAVAPTAMNGLGRIVGTFPLAPANERAWVAGPGSPLVPLPLPAGRVSSRAYDINEAGVIAGAVSSASYADPNFGAVAAIWTPDGSGGYTIAELGKLPGDIGSAATALNDVGDVVGHSQGGMYRRAVWFTSPTGIFDLSPTGAFDPRRINDQRVMVCYSTSCSRLDLDTMVLENLGAPPGSYFSSQGAAINASNQVGGLAILTTSTSCDRQAARYTDGIGWEVFGGCGPNNGAGDINDQGDITMWLNTASFVRFEGLGTYRTEDLISAPVGHWYLFIGTGLINNARQIACAGSNSATGESGILLLSPKSADPRTYCTAKSNSCATLPAMGFAGTPSATSGSGFSVSSSNTKALKSGLLLYTDAGPQNLPFQGGTLCLNPAPLKRSVPVSDSSGTPGLCNGVLSIDMNAFAQGGLGGSPLPSLLVPGTRINCQFWGRDTIANGALLSNALEYFVGA